MELPDDEQPPEEIWLNSKLVNEHFEELARKRRDPSDSESVPMMQNDLTSGLR